MIHKIVHILIRILLVVFGACLLLFISLQLSPVQNFIAQKVVQKVNENYDIPLSVDQVGITFFNRVKAKDVMLGTPDGDTVFYTSEVAVRIRLIPLLDNHIHVKKLGLTGARINLEKAAGDSVLNVVSLFQSMPEKEKSQEQKPPPRFDLDKLVLNDIQFQLKNHADTSEIYAQLEHFELRCQAIDLKTKKIALHSVTLEGASVDIIQIPSVQPEKSPEPFPYEFSLEHELAIKNSHFAINNRVSKQEIAVQNINLSLRTNNLNIRNQQLDLAYLELSNTGINIHQGKVNREDSIRLSHLDTATADNDLAWNIRLEQLVFDENSFNQANENISGTEEKSKNFVLSGITADISKIGIGKDHYVADIRSLAIDINDQFEIKDMKALAEVNDQSAVLNNVQIASGNSSLAFDARVDYPDMKRIAEQPGQVDLSLKMKGKAGSKDLQRWMSGLSILKSYPDITFSGTLNGKLADMQMENVMLKAGKAIDLQVNGHVNNLQDISRVSGDMYINTFSIDQEELAVYLPDTLFPQTIQLPKNIQVQGQVTGNTTVVTSDLKISTTFGDMRTHLYANLDSIPGKEYFAAQLDIDHFDAGALLNNPDTIGKIALTGNFTGQLSQFTNPEMSMDVQIQHIDLLGYPYKDIAIAGDYRKNYFKGRTAVNDTNISFLFNGTIDLSDSIPVFDADLHVRHAHLGQLQVTPDRTDVAANISMHVTGSKWNALKGNVLAGSLLYTTDKQEYQLDSLKVDLIQQPDSSNYNVRFNALSIDDSMMVGQAGVFAVIRGEKADIQYQVWKDQPMDDTVQAWVQGHGNLVFTQDSLWVKNHLQMERSRYPEPIRVDMELSRVTREPGIQDMTARMTGMGVNLNASGQMEKQDGEDAVNARVNIDSLDLGLVRPFVTNLFATLEGHVKGQFQVTGPVKDPDIDGMLSLKNTTINPYMLNTDFIFEDEKIHVNKSIFRFDELTVKDHANNTAMLDGTINLDKEALSNFNLSLGANSFRLFNIKASESDMYYGQVVVDLDASISGTFESPVVTLNVAFNDKSDFNYVVPQKQVSAQEKEGVVEFVSIREDQSVQDTLAVQTGMESQMRGVDLGANLEITDKMTMTIITDPASDENLEFAGNGNLNFTINRSGDMSLAGKYIIEKGKYRLRLYDVLVREFDIQKGSSLNWTGDIMGPSADITAVYKLRATPGNLVQNRTGGTEKYKAAIPVEVVMKLTGNLLTPEIDFDIRLDKRHQGSEIYSIISNLNENESELNKQVFSLLIFNRFSSEMLGGSSTVAYNLQNTAMESLSSVLSEQLNRFSRQYIRGVDVSFDIDSYGQSNRQDFSSRTDLNVDISRNLFSDRLTIEVGGRVAVQENNANESGSAASDNLAGDFKLEYKLTKDGTYRLQAFNKTEFEDEIEDEVTKTGISFIINKDFTRLKELFNKDNKEE